MKNQRQVGDCITIAAPSGGVVGGKAYLIGRLFGVAAYDAAQTVLVPFWIRGVFQLPKIPSQAWTSGAAIYWDNTANQYCTNVAGALKGIGWATEDVDSAAGSILGYVCLTPMVS